MVIIFCGVPGSGKSTIAKLLKEKLEKFGKTRIFVSDKVSGKVYKRWRDEVLALAGEEAVIVIYVYCKLETCIERNKKRKPSLPERVIHIINRKIERPENPYVSINTDTTQPEEAVSKVLAKVTTRKQNDHFPKFASQIIKQ